MNIPTYDRVFKIKINGVDYVCTDYILAPIFGEGSSLFRISSDSVLTSFRIDASCAVAHAEDPDTCRDCKKRFIVRDPSSYVYGAVISFYQEVATDCMGGRVGCSSTFGNCPTFYKITPEKSFHITIDSSSVIIEKVLSTELNTYKKLTPDIEAEIREKSKEAAIFEIATRLVAWKNQYKSVFFPEEIPPLPEIVYEPPESLWKRLCKKIFK